MKNIIIVDMQEGFINENNNHIVEKINNYIATNTFDNTLLLSVSTTMKARLQKFYTGMELQMKNSNSLFATFHQKQKF